MTSQYSTGKFSSTKVLYSGVTLRLLWSWKEGRLWFSCFHLLLSLTLELYPTFYLFSADTGFRHVEPTKYIPRLFQFRRQKVLHNILIINYTDRQTDRRAQTDRRTHTDRRAQTDRQTDRQTHTDRQTRADRQTHTDRRTQTDRRRQIDRRAQTDRRTQTDARSQTDTRRQTDAYRQTNRQTGKHVDKLRQIDTKNKQTSTDKQRHKQTHRLKCGNRQRNKQTKTHICIRDLLIKLFLIHRELF